MFDWDDGELSSVIWGEAGESNNHIVRCPEQFEVHKKRRNEQVSTLEQNLSIIKPDHWVDLGRLFTYDAEPDSFCTDASNNLTKGHKNSFLGEEASEFDTISELFEKPAEDRGESGFAFCGWENVGSFGDLDRIFSNNVSMFGDSAVTEDLSSSIDITSIPLKFTPTPGDTSRIQLGLSRSSSDQSRITYHNSLDPSLPSSSGYEEIIGISYKAPQDIQDSRRRKSVEAAKVNRKNVSSMLHGSAVSWTLSSKPLHHLNSLPSLASPLALSQKRPTPVNPQAFHLKNFASANSTAPFYGSIISHQSAPSILLSSGYAAPPNSENASPKAPPPMTPREKIEKLRRRQQMRAIRALQNQKLQFTCPESAGQGISSFPILEPRSPLEQDNPSHISTINENCSVEESVLYQLQDTVAKLDMRTRLSLRDSLFRLAESAMQRQNPHDTGSTCASSGDEIHSCTELSHQRYTRMPNRETETNPIDRAMAHLLFRRPEELSGKPTEPSGSPSSECMSKRLLSSGSQFRSAPFFQSWIQNNNQWSSS